MVDGTGEDSASKLQFQKKEGSSDILRAHANIECAATQSIGNDHLHSTAVGRTDMGNG